MTSSEEGCPPQWLVSFLSKSGLSFKGMLSVFHIHVIVHPGKSQTYSNHPEWESQNYHLVTPGLTSCSGLAVLPLDRAHSSQLPSWSPQSIQQVSCKGCAGRTWHHRKLCHAPLCYFLAFTFQKTQGRRPICSNMCDLPTQRLKRLRRQHGCRDSEQKSTLGIASLLFP